MFWIVGGGMVMPGLSALGHNFIIDSIARQLDHTPWVGLRFYDCIWPELHVDGGGFCTAFSGEALSYRNLPSAIGSCYSTSRSSVSAGLGPGVDFTWFALLG